MINLNILSYSYASCKDAQRETLFQSNRPNFSDFRTRHDFVSVILHFIRGGKEKEGILRSPPKEKIVRQLSQNVEKEKSRKKDTVYGRIEQLI